MKNQHRKTIREDVQIKKLGQGMHKNKDLAPGMTKPLKATVYKGHYSDSTWLCTDQLKLYHGSHGSVVTSTLNRRPGVQVTMTKYHWFDFVELLK